MMRVHFQRLTIAGKLRVIITVACVIVILFTSACLMLAETVILRSRMVASLTARAEVLSLNAAAAVTFHSHEGAEEVLRASGADPGTLAAAIFDATGTPFARYAAGPDESEIPPPATLQLLHAFTTRTLTVWLPMQAADGRVIGTLALRMSLSELYGRLAIFGAVSVCVVLAMTLLALFLSDYLQRIFSAPIVELATAAKRVTRTQDYSVRVRKCGTDELSHLAGAFNVMLEAAEASRGQLEAKVTERTAELQQAYRELEAFSYSVSHDLRAPLRTITGFTETILEDSGNRLNPEGIQHAQKIIAASSRMNRLIDGLLDFSRVPKREMRAEQIDLHAMARDVAAELRTETAGRRVLVSVEPLPPALGDPTLIRQVLVNLIGNAFKYSRERDPAVITIAPVTGFDTHNNVYVVRDNGAGFDMKHATRLFQVFERLHDARQFEGTGIGLATSKRIVERHGGRMWAEGTVDAGAAFYFTLPCRRAESAPRPSRKGR